MNNKILLIDDEPQIRKFVKKTLLVLGFDVEEAVDAKHATQMFERYKPDLVILDLGLPDQDGQNWLQNLRKNYQTLLIVVSARSDTDEVVKALESGANDYVKKPFDMPELVARIKRLLAHVGGEELINQHTVYQFANMTVDIANHEVRIDNEMIHLSKKEFLLLSQLVQHAGKLVTQRHLLKLIWGEYFSDEVQYLRVYIGQLRKKLAACTKAPLITTESGVGYRFVEVD